MITDFQNNPFHRGDRVQLWIGYAKPLPDNLVNLVVNHAYVVEDIVLDQVMIEGRLYFCSRFMLLGESS